MSSEHAAFTLSLAVAASQKNDEPPPPDKVRRRRRGIKGRDRLVEWMGAMQGAARSGRKSPTKPDLGKIQTGGKIQGRHTSLVRLTLPE